jgi:hypothetical protein
MFHLETPDICDNNGGHANLSFINPPHAGFSLPESVPSELDALLSPLSLSHRPRRAQMIEDSILQCLYP